MLYDMGAGDQKGQRLQDFDLFDSVFHQHPQCVCHVARALEIDRLVHYQPLHQSQAKFHNLEIIINSCINYLLQ